MNLDDARKHASLLHYTAMLLIELAEENEALRALQSPPALLPIADIPVRQVTGIDVEEEPE